MGAVLARKKRARDIGEGFVHLFGAPLLFIPQIITALQVNSFKDKMPKTVKKRLLAAGSEEIPSSDPLYKLFDDEASKQGIEIDGLFREKSDKYAFNAGVFSIDKKNATFTMTFNDAAKPMNDRLMRSVINHEFSHVHNEDSRRRLMGTGVSSSYTLLGLGTIIMTGAFTAGLSLMLVGATLNLVNMFNARNQEYIADLESAGRTKDPEAMINSLEKMHKENMALNPGKYSDSRLARIGATHPSIKDRVACIREEFNLAGGPPDSCDSFDKSGNKRDYKSEGHGPDLNI
jgi:Zn-dependent protease with chaperone function